MLFGSRSRAAELLVGIVLIALLVPATPGLATTELQMIAFDQPTGTALGETWFPPLRDIDVKPECGATNPVECPGGVPVPASDNLRLTRQSLDVVLQGPGTFNVAADLAIETLDPIAITVSGIDCDMTITSANGAVPTVHVTSQGTLLTDGSGLFPYNYLAPGSVTVTTLEAADVSIGGGFLCASLGWSLSLFVGWLQDWLATVIQDGGTLCGVAAPTLLVTCPWLEVTPSLAAFGSIAVGSTSTKTITVTNSGPVNFMVNLGQATIEGADAGSFSVEVDGCSDTTLYHGPCTIDVAFSPSTSGARSATLVLPSSWVTSPDAVALTGEGVDPPDAPVISGLGPVRGTACAGCTITVYSVAANLTKHVEGTTTADGTGHWTYPELVLGPTMTATATSIGGTSGDALGVAFPTPPFTDIGASGFKTEIAWLYANGITTGCTATTFCPTASVTREQMASFLARALRLPATATDFFDDDDGTTHEANINRIAAAGITTGCGVRLYCPKGIVLRDQMASFLARAAGLTTGAGRNYFSDDDGNTHEANIDRAAAAGIATGCGSYVYCPASGVTREQMAAFLRRLIAPVGSPPYPAP